MNLISCNCRIDINFLDKHITSAKVINGIHKIEIEFSDIYTL